MFVLKNLGGHEPHGPSDLPREWRGKYLLYCERYSGRIAPHNCGYLGAIDARLTLLIGATRLEQFGEDLLATVFNAHRGLRSAGLLELRVRHYNFD